VGPIAGRWLKAQTKLEILTVIANSQQQGVSARRSCSLLMIEHRRVVRWQQQARQGRPLANLIPGPKDPLHRVLPAEIDQIVTLARSQEYVDLSHRILAVTAWDKGLFQASFSTVYRVLKERNLMTARGPSRPHNGHSKPPVRKDLTGPNQRWCWDISYLPTLQQGEYLFLYLLLDEWSRKAIQWRIDWQQSAEESRRLLAGGLRDQNILDLPAERRPEVINDRGRQMKAKPIQRLCEDHGLPQLFARPPPPP
jgi:putative transposase